MLGVRSRTRFLYAVLAAGITTLLVTEPGFARQKAKGLAAKAPDQKAAQKKAGLVQLKKEEVAALRKAYFLLAEANHDYDGHRAKAMGHVKHAVELLEGGKDLYVQWEKEKAKRTPRLHEPQSWSDAQLRQAAGVLQELAKGMAQAKQQRVHEHVEKAAAQIGVALQIR